MPMRRATCKLMVSLDGSLSGALAIHIGLSCDSVELGAFE